MATDDRKADSESINRSLRSFNIDAPAIPDGGYTDAQFDALDKVHVEANRRRNEGGSYVQQRQAERDEVARAQQEAEQSLLRNLLDTARQPQETAQTNPAEFANFDAQVDSDRLDDMAYRDRTSQFGKGLRSAGQQLLATGPGVEAIARGWAGDEEGATAAARRAGDRLNRAAELGPQQSLSGVMDGDDEFGDWVAGALGQQAPILATFIGTGVVGGLAGRVTQKSIERGVLRTVTEQRGAAVAARNVQQEALRRASQAYVSTQSRRSGGQAARAVSRRDTADNAVRQIQQEGQEWIRRTAAQGPRRETVYSTVAAGATGVPLYSADTSQFLIDPDAEGSIRYKAAVALTGATIASLASIAPTVAVLRRLGLGTQAAHMQQLAAQSAFRRLPAEGGKQALLEGSAEVAAEVGKTWTHSWINDNIDVFGAEQMAGYIESAAVGAMLGGGLGTATSVRPGDFKELGSFMMRFREPGPTEMATMERRGDAETAHSRKKNAPENARAQEQYDSLDDDIRAQMSFPEFLNSLRTDQGRTIALGRLVEGMDSTEAGTYLRLLIDPDAENIAATGVDMPGGAQSMGDTAYQRLAQSVGEENMAVLLEAGRQQMTASTVTMLREDLKMLNTMELTPEQARATNTRIQNARDLLARLEQQAADAGMPESPMASQIDELIPGLYRDASDTSETTTPRGVEDESTQDTQAVQEGIERADAGREQNDFLAGTQEAETNLTLPFAENDRAAGVDARTATKAGRQRLGTVGAVWAKGGDAAKNAQSINKDAGGDPANPPARVETLDRAMDLAELSAEDKIAAARELWDGKNKFQRGQLQEQTGREAETSKEAIQSVEEANIMLGQFETVVSERLPDGLSGREQRSFSAREVDSFVIPEGKRLDNVGVAEATTPKETEESVVAREAASQEGRPEPKPVMKDAPVRVNLISAVQRMIGRLDDMERTGPKGDKSKTKGAAETSETTDNTGNISMSNIARALNQAVADLREKGINIDVDSLPADTVVFKRAGREAVTAGEVLTRDKGRRETAQKTAAASIRDLETQKAGIEAALKEGGNKERVAKLRADLKRNERAFAAKRKERQKVVNELNARARQLESELDRVERALETDSKGELIGEISKGIKAFRGTSDRDLSTQELSVKNALRIAMDILTAPTVERSKSALMRARKRISDAEAKIAAHDLLGALDRLTLKARFYNGGMRRKAVMREFVANELKGLNEISFNDPFAVETAAFGDQVASSSEVLSSAEANTLQVENRIDQLRELTDALDGRIEAAETPEVRAEQERLKEELMEELDLLVSLTDDKAKYELESREASQFEGPTKRSGKGSKGNAAEKPSAKNTDLDALVKSGKAILKDDTYYVTDAEATPYVAGSTSDGKIYVNIALSKSQPLEIYIQNSDQKVEMLRRLGVSAAQFASLFKSQREVNAFLRDHERSHLQNRDREVYPRKEDGSFDLMHPDAVAIEARATIDGLTAAQKQQLEKMQAPSAKKQRAQVKALEAVASRMSNETSTEQRQAEAKFADGVIKGLKLAQVTMGSVLSNAEAAERVQGKNIDLNAHDGLSFTTMNRDTGEITVDIWVNESITDPAERMGVLNHEIGHAVVTSSAFKLSTEDARSLVGAYNKWRKENKEGSVGATIKSKRSLLNMLDARVNDPRQLKDLSQVERDNLLDFQEWFADNVGRWIETNKRPRGVIEKFFSSIAQALRILMRTNRDAGLPDSTVASVLNNMWDSKQPNGHVRKFSLWKRLEQHTELSKIKVEGATAKPLRVELPKKTRFAAKDQRKADLALTWARDGGGRNLFIGRGSASSSTNAYAKAYGKNANVGRYKDGDAVFVSAEGNRGGRIGPDFKELKAAADAGVVFITDNKANRNRPYNKGEREVADFLLENGYKEGVQEGVWHKEGKPRNKKPSFSEVYEEIRAQYKGEIDPKRALTGAVEAAVSPSSIEAFWGVRDYIIGKMSSKERMTIGRALTSSKVQRQMNQARAHAAKKGQFYPSDPHSEMALAYILHSQGKLDLTPAQAAPLRAATRWFHEITGKVHQSDQAVEVLNAIQQDLFGARTNEVQAQAKKGSKLANAEYVLESAQLQKLAQLEALGRLDDTNSPERIDQMVDALPNHLFPQRMKDALKDDIKAGVFTKKFLDQFKNESDFVLNPDKQFAVTEFVGTAPLQNSARAVYNNLAGAKQYLRNSLLGRGVLGQAMRSRGSRSAAVQSFQQALYTDVLQEGGAEGFVNAKDRASGARQSEWESIYDTLTVEQQKAFREAFLGRETPTDPAVKAAIARTNRFMRSMHKYGQEVGLLKRTRFDENYRPWSFDAGKVDRHANKLLEAWTHKRYRKEWWNVYADHYPERVGDAKDFASDTEFETYVQAYIASIALENGFVDAARPDQDEIGTRPYVANLNRRELAFLDNEKLAPPADRKLLASLFDDSINTTMAKYIGSMVKRVEYVRKFGANDEKYLQLRAQAKEQGATREDLALMDDMIRSATGRIGLEVAPFWKKVASPFNSMLQPIRNDDGTPFATKEDAMRVQKAEGVQGTVEKVEGGFEIKRDITADPRRFRQNMSWLVVYQNWRILALAALTNVADLAGIAFRTGDLPVAFGAYKEGVGRVFKDVRDRKQSPETRKANMDSAERLAVELGAVAHATVSEHLGLQYGSVHMTGKAKRWNDILFKYNGMEYLTRATRIMAVSAGREFLAKQAAGAARGDAASIEALTELGLDPADLRLTEEGGLDLLTGDEVRTALEGTEFGSAQGASAAQAEGQDVGVAAAEVARDERVRRALARMVDESVLRPASWQRATWMNDPNWQLFSHLKGFMYTYHERVLRRIIGKGVSGNLGPLVMAAGYVGTMMAADLLREMIQHGPEGDDRKERWGVKERVADGIHRSGLLGMYTVVPDMMKTHEFGRSQIAQVGGPFTSQLEQLYRGMFGAGDPSTALKRALPGNQIYTDPFVSWGSWIVDPRAADPASGALDVPLIRPEVSEALGSN